TGGGGQSPVGSPDSITARSLARKCGRRSPIPAARLREPSTVDRFPRSATMSTQATPVPRVSPSPPCATDGRAPWALALARSPLRRGVGVLLVAGSLGYLGWLIATLNHTYWWLAWPFMVANL